MTSTLKDSEKEVLKLLLEISNFSLEEEVEKFYERQQAECAKIKEKIRVIEACVDLNNYLGLSEQENACYEKLLEEHEKLKGILAILGG